MSRLFFGGLNYKTTSEDLRRHVELQGYSVEDVHVVTDRDSGKSKGFGFVTLGGSEDGDRAMSDLNGSTLDGRKLTVNKALPKPAKAARR